VTRRRRLVLAWGAAGVVMLGAVSAALINELHGGWGWRVGAGVAVVLWAAATGWLALRTGGGDGGVRVRAGGVHAGRDIGGPVNTHARGTSVIGGGEAPAPLEGIDIGHGTVFAGRDITGGVTTEVDGASERTRERRGVRRGTERPVGPPPPPLPPPLPASPEATEYG
jgi:hypothetical protein